jgi:hypothetical protein
MFKRLMVAAGFTALALSLDAAVAFAHEKSEQTVIKSRSFTIAKGRCPLLPANVEVQGLGLERTTTDIEGGDDSNDEGGRVDLRGTLLSRITGTATDNLGGSYTFNYQLIFGFGKPVPIPGSGIGVDTFTLTGTGVANGLSTLIRARVTFDSGFNPIAFDILEQSGHPFGCDPL